MSDPSADRIFKTEPHEMRETLAIAVTKAETFNGMALLLKMVTAQALIGIFEELRGIRQFFNQEKPR